MSANDIKMDVFLIDILGEQEMGTVSIIFLPISVFFYASKTAPLSSHCSIYAYKENVVEL